MYARRPLIRYRFAFDVPNGTKADFKYIAGQYLTLKMNLNGGEIRRSYSLCSCPVSDDEWRIAVKQVEGGQMSTFINKSLNAGDSIEVMPPMGNFCVETNSSNSVHYVGFAAGSGITPVISILKSTLHDEPGSRFTLLYGNRDNNSIIFKTELEELQAKYGDRLTVVYVLSREATDDPLHNGRIDADKARQLIDKYVDTTEASKFFLCGPEEMIRTVSSLLENLRVDKSNIHFELFTTPVAAEGGGSVMEYDGDPVDAQVTVIIDGDEVEFNLNTNDDPILDAALDAGADAPFACKGAVCCTCRAKVTEGQVKMDMNYALEDEEVEDGYVLTCQAHPISEKVVVDFDA